LIVVNTENPLLTAGQVGAWKADGLARRRSSCSSTAVLSAYAACNPRKLALSPIRLVFGRPQWGATDWLRTGWKDGIATVGHAGLETTKAVVHDVLESRQGDPRVGGRWPWRVWSKRRKCMAMILAPKCTMWWLTCPCNARA